MFETIIIAVATSCIPLVLKFGMNRMERNQKKLHLDVKRLELLHLIDHNPNNGISIHKEYDAYKEMGGNSYIDVVYLDWCKKFDNK